jgi:NAD kinase
MDRLSRKIVVVTRPTRLDQLVRRFNTTSQARFYIERLGGDFGDYEREHECFSAALDMILDAAARIARVHHIDWTQTPNYQFAADDLVATVGQDGLIVNTLKYLDEQPIIGFNPEKSRWDGLLAQFSCEEAHSALEKALAEELPERRVTKALVKLSDSQTMVAVNDFFLGVNDHGSARYTLAYSGQEESQSSSGLIVSTPLGRSGWLQSIINGSSGIVGRMHGGKKLMVRAEGRRSWDDDYLYFAVREPYASVSSGADLIFGKLSPDTPLTIESKMGEKGIIFSDGMQSDYLEFNHSVRSTFTIAPAKGRVLVAGT